MTKDKVKENEKCVRLNSVVLEEASLNRCIKVYMESHDMPMKELNKETEKQFNDM